MSFEQVLPSELVGSVSVLQWLPAEQALQFSYGKGGRQSVERLDTDYFDSGHHDEQLHPYSTWWLDESLGAPRAREAIRLPAHPIGLGEPSWCRRAIASASTWCHWNFKKGSERNLRLLGGNGLDEALEFDVFDIPGGVHSGAYDFDETAEGLQFWVFKKGIANASSFVAAFDRISAPDPVVTTV